VLLEAGLNVDLAGGALTVKVADKPNVTVWVIEPPQSAVTLFTPEVLTGVIQTTIWPKLQAGIEGALSIQLPIPPLNAIAGVAPSLAGLELTTGLNQRITYRNGYLVLDADIAATLP
jgi:hypothetical protein